MDSQVEFRRKNQESEPQERIVLESTILMQQHNFDILIQEKE